MLRWLSSKFFPIHYSPIILSFKAIYSKTLTVVKQTTNECEIKTCYTKYNYAISVVFHSANIMYSLL
jgi:hypothetical protein